MKHHLDLRPISQAVSITDISLFTDFVHQYYLAKQSAAISSKFFDVDIAVYDNVAWDDEEKSLTIDASIEGMIKKITIKDDESSEYIESEAKPKITLDDVLERLDKVLTRYNNRCILPSYEIIHLINWIKENK
jgi:hypothetical protein